MRSSRIALTILGGGREIAANSYLVEWRGYRVLLDCGFDLTNTGYDALPLLELLGDRAIDAAIVSHAHIDHCGSLPVLVDHFLAPRSRVFVTPPNEVLIPVMLMDSAKIQGFSRFIRRDVHDYEWSLTEKKVAKLFLGGKPLASRKFHEEFEIVPGLTARFFPAGHILGAAGVVVSDGTYTIAYTGDICAHEQTLHYGCALPEGVRADCVISESTRGSVEAVLGVNRTTEALSLAREIRAGLSRGGHVLMPSFALGRTQDLVLSLALMKQSGAIPRETPVFYHQGLTAKINNVYDRFPHDLKPVGPLMLDNCCRAVNAFQARDGFKTARELSRVPSIFVFTGGMLTRGTASARLAAELVRSEKNSILFTGYIDPEELGYEVATASLGEALCFDPEATELVEIRCPHRYRFSLSSHSDREDLVAIVEHFNPDTVVWVHGEAQSTEWLSDTFSARNARCRSLRPRNGETIVLRE